MRLVEGAQAGARAGAGGRGSRRCPRRAEALTGSCGYRWRTWWQVVAVMVLAARDRALVGPLAAEKWLRALCRRRPAAELRRTATSGAGESARRAEIPSRPSIPRPLARTRPGKSGRRRRRATRPVARAPRRGERGRARAGEPTGFIDVVMCSSWSLKRRAIPLWGQTRGVRRRREGCKDGLARTGYRNFALFLIAYG